MRALLFFLFISFVALPGLAQTGDQLVAAADQVYRSGARRQALDQYLLALNQNPNNVKANYMAGVCYLQTIQKELSLKYLLRAQELDPRFTSDMVRGVDLYPDLTYLIGLSFHLGENYDRAIEYYQRFSQQIQKGEASRTALDDQADAERLMQRRIYECGIAKSLTRNPVLVKIKAVDNINSPYPDYGPALDSAQKTMVFTSRRPGGGSNDVASDLYHYEDVYMSTRTDSVWSAPKLVPEITTPQHEASVALSADGKTLLLFKQEGGGNIYISRRSGEKWSSPKALDRTTINSPYRETSAWITADGRYIYFASDRPGGFGGLDLYASEHLGNDRWGVPINLGPRVNTEWDDDVPMLTADRRNLYFSSRGHKGMGGYDIFRSRFDTARGIWLEPKNLGYPVNTPDDDIYYFQGKDSLSAYFSSLRDFGVGDIDIFQLTYLPTANLSADSLRRLQEAQAEQLALEGLPDTSALNQQLANMLDQEAAVPDSADLYGGARNQNYPSLDDMARALKEGKDGKDKKGKSRRIRGKDGEDEDDANQMIAVRIAVRDRRTKTLIPARVRFSKVGSNEELEPEEEEPGVYVLRIPRSQAGKYVVSAETEGYMFRNLTVTVTRKGGDINKVFEMDEKGVNKGLALRNVYFDFNQATLKPTSERELKVVYRFLKANPKMVIEIAGHTDNIGGEDYNLALSRRRSEAVVRWLVGHGINAGRLVPQGYGENKPLATNDDEREGRELNRRSEFVILADKSR